MGKVTLRNSGFIAVRQSPGVMAELNKQAEAMRARANGLKTKPKADYQAVPAITTDHGSIALVSTGKGSETAGETAVDNAINNTLAKAVG